jgi:acyl-CoA thioesterase-1
LVQTFALAAAFAAFLAGVIGGTGAVQGAANDAAADRPVTIVALGDSLTAGLGLPASAAFPAKLQAVLKARGHAVEIVNAGVSGDTATGGLSRLDWSVPEGTDAVILELGANDMLRGLDSDITRRALDETVRRLTERRIPVLLAGMRAIPNLGIDYVRGFEAIYPEIAAKYDVLFYPFFLDGIAGEARFNQRDRLHPLAIGIDVIVAGILPKVEELLIRARNRRGP